MNLKKMVNLLRSKYYFSMSEIIFIMLTVNSYLSNNIYNFYHIIVIMRATRGARVTIVQSKLTISNHNLHYHCSHGLHHPDTPNSFAISRSK